MVETGMEVKDEDLKPAEVEQSAASFFDQQLEKASDENLPQFDEVTNLKDVIELKENKMKDKSEELSKLQEELNTFVEASKTSSAEIENLKESSSSSLIEIERLNGEIDNTKLRLEVVNLTKQLTEASEEANMLRTELNLVNQALIAVTAEEDLARSHLIDLQNQMDKLSSDKLGLKAEYDSLKFKYDMVANEKEESPSELTEFQSLNANLNAEIASLRQYIEKQHLESCLIGNFTWEDGGPYEGEYKDGLQHGTGKSVYPDGANYIGEWVQGNIQGHGNMSYASGNVYSGQWVHGRFSGNGTYT